MAEKPKDKKDDKKPAHKHHSSGGISFGLEIILFMVAIFVIWVLMGKPKTENADKAFIKGQPMAVPQ
jgi:flagellar basal body-associated protein FliL